MRLYDLRVRVGSRHACCDRGQIGKLHRTQGFGESGSVLAGYCKAQDSFWSDVYERRSEVIRPLGVTCEVAEGQTTGAWHTPGHEDRLVRR